MRPHVNVTTSRDGKRRTTIRVNYRADAHIAAIACVDAGLKPEDLTHSKVDDALRAGLFLHGVGLLERMERQQDGWYEDDEGESYESRHERLKARINAVTGLD
jgi:hypothetical protein